MKGGEIKKKLRKMGENNKRRDKYQVRRRQRQRERETMRWMDRNGKRMHGGGERRTEGLFCCLSISSCSTRSFISSHADIKRERNGEDNATHDRHLST